MQEGLYDNRSIEMVMFVMVETLTDAVLPPELLYHN